MALRTAAYTLWSIAALLLAYAIPYGLLARCRGAELYAFWLLLAALHVAVTYAYLRGGEAWRG